MFRVRHPNTILRAACLALLASACGGNSVSPVAPVAPTPAAAPPSFPVVRLTGQVSDVAGRPLVANVVVFPLRMSEAWYGAWGRGSDSDGSGHYQIANAPEQLDTAYVRAWKDGYVQQCATAVTLATATSADLTLTPKADVAIVGLPTVPNSRQIGGTVYTTKDGLRQPFAGAWVGWEMSMDTVVADTLTDSQGRYRLCGMPKDRISGLYAVKAGTSSPVYTELAAGGDAVVDFDLLQ
jgi:hypothetical protein